MRAFLVAVVVAGVVTMGASAAVAAQGDSTVQNSGLIVGYDVLNTTGQGQTITKSIKPGKTKTFVWTVVNWDTTGILNFFGSEGSNCFRVRYHNIEAENITTAIVNGAQFSTPGGFSYFPITVEIKAKDCAASGQSKTVNLDVSPPKGGGGFDRARAKVRVK